jgi:hypothetical protein
VGGNPHELAKGQIFSGVLDVEMNRGDAYSPPPAVLKSLRVLVGLLFPQQGG